jgi:hypothetical protein
MYDKTAWPSMTSSLSLMVLIAAREAALFETDCGVPGSRPFSKACDSQARQPLTCALLSNAKNSLRMAVHPQDTARLQYIVMNLSLIIQYAAHWRWGAVKARASTANVVAHL